MKNIVIFASGTGSNAKNIAEYFKNFKQVTVIAIFTNNPNAAVIEKAHQLQIPVEIFSKQELTNGRVLNLLNNLKPTLIILAGFLLKFPETIIQSYRNKIINIHPALLPKYGGKGMYGMNVHEAVVQNKEKETGITIHYVNENYDEGEIIFQKKVSLLNTDTAAIVSKKIHELEQRYFPSVIEKLCANIK